MKRFISRSITTDDGAAIPFVQFGRGPVQVVTLPGAGDGLSTVKQAALQLAWMYRARWPHCRMTVFSRRIPYPPRFGVEALARDLIAAVDQLGIGQAVWELNSAGGPVGQQVAFQRPDLVQGMVLTSTLHRMHPVTRATIHRWMGFVREQRWGDLLWDTMLATYTPAYVKRYQLLKPLLPLLANPGKNAERLVNLLQDLLPVDHREQLGTIQCPVWISHGAEDAVIPLEIAEEAHRLLPHSTLRVYPGYGHGNEVENPVYGIDFLSFLQSFS